MKPKLNDPCKAMLYALTALSFLALLSKSGEAARAVETETFSLTPELSQPDEDLVIPGVNLRGAPTTGDDGNDEQVSIRISKDVSILPAPVRSMRNRLVEAARSGDMEQLRAIVATIPQPPLVAYDEIEDPIEHLLSLSGDSDGHEILAILLEVLEAGYAHEAAGTDQEIFIWPYFARISLEELIPAQRVELFTLVTAGDYEDMRIFGAYNFFRLGISREGNWQYFISGD